MTLSRLALLPGSWNVLAGTHTHTHTHTHQKTESNQAINVFLRDLPQTTEVWSQCVKLDHVRDWKGLLADLPVHVSGIGGPGAAHRFRYIRRHDLPRGVLPIVPAIWNGVPAHAQDIILTALNRMSDPETEPTLPPTLYIPYHVVIERPEFVLWQTFSWWSCFLVAGVGM
jgi:hypothetical protein